MMGGVLCHPIQLTVKTATLAFQVKKKKKAPKILTFKASQHLAPKVKLLNLCLGILFQDRPDFSEHL